jgi:hypothetical protein
MTRKNFRILLLPPLLVAYGLSFLAQDKLFFKTAPNLQPAPAARFLRATTGYLHQLTAEILFVQSAIFLGGLKPGADQKSYAPALAHNYRQITTLYPQFIDPYFYTQSYLAPIAPEYAEAANEILATGRVAAPDNLIYPFFQGFNCFRSLNAPLKAAKVFQEASQLPKAPPMFAHLATIFTAQGGQLQAAIFSLQLMLKTTEDKGVQKRYQEEIEMFEDALKVQRAVDAFFAARQGYPKNLQELVPEYLAALPSFGSAFEVTWQAPVVGLKRPKL